MCMGVLYNLMSSFEFSVDPDEKPADQDPHCSSSTK